MTQTAAEARAQAEAARQKLAGTVGELGGAIDETKQEVVGKAKMVAPIAAGIVATLVLLKLTRRR